jgi:hypothetical protein
VVGENGEYGLGELGKWGWELLGLLSGEVVAGADCNYR